jgi:hypothetical protein
MGVVNTKSTAITNADASSRVPNSPYIERGLLQSSVAKVNIAAADSNTSTYRLMRLSSSMRLHSLKLLFDAITGGTSFKLGLYDTAANGGAAVSSALFGNAIDLSGGNVQGQEVLNQNNSIANMEKRIWELLGLSADSFKDYDLVLTATTIGTSGGNVAALATYVI